MFLYLYPSMNHHRIVNICLNRLFVNILGICMRMLNSQYYPHKTHHSIMNILFMICIFYSCMRMAYIIRLLVPVLCIGTCRMFMLISMSMNSAVGSTGQCMPILGSNARLCMLICITMRVVGSKLRIGEGLACECSFVFCDSYIKN